MLLLVFVRDAATPAAFLLLSYAILLVGVSFTRRLVGVLLALPLAAAAIGFGFSLWTDPSKVDQSVVIWQIGSWTLYGGALAVGLATGLRHRGHRRARADRRALDDRARCRAGIRAAAARALPHRLHRARRVPLRAALRARARGHPAGAPRARRARRPRSVLGDRALVRLHRPAHGRRDPPRRARRPRDGRPRLRRPPRPHRAAPRARSARATSCSSRCSWRPRPRSSSLFFPWGSVPSPAPPHLDRTPIGGSMALTSRLVKPANAGPAAPHGASHARRLSPHWMRITLGGGEIDAFRADGLRPVVPHLPAARRRRGARAAPRQGAQALRLPQVPPHPRRHPSRSCATTRCAPSGPRDGGRDAETRRRLRRSTAPPTTAPPVRRRAGPRRAQPGESVVIIDEGLAFNPEREHRPRRARRGRDRPAGDRRRSARRCPSDAIRARDHRGAGTRGRPRVRRTPTGSRFAGSSAMHDAKPGEPRSTPDARCARTSCRQPVYHAYIVGEQALPTEARRHLVVATAASRRTSCSFCGVLARWRAASHPERDRDEQVHAGASSTATCDCAAMAHRLAAWGRDGPSTRSSPSCRYLGRQRRSGAPEFAP